MLRSLRPVVFILCTLGAVVGFFIMGVTINDSAYSHLIPNGSYDYRDRLFRGGIVLSSLSITAMITFAIVTAPKPRHPHTS